MTILYTNNASTLLASTIVDDVQTTFSVSTGDGILFPLPTGGDYFVIAIEDAAANIELMKVTNKAGDLFTVERGFDNSTARAWSVGARIELRITAHQMEECIQRNGDTMTGALQGPDPTQPQDYATKDYTDTASTIQFGTENNMVSIDAVGKPKDSGLAVGNISQAELDILDGATISTAHLNDTATVTGTETLTNKTLTSPTINSGTLDSPVLNTAISGTAFKDEDNMASNSATAVASQQSIKAYVDNLLAGERLVLLNTPENLVNTSDAGTSAWTTVNSTTLNNANATKAILRVYTYSAIRSSFGDGAFTITVAIQKPGVGGTYTIYAVSSSESQVSSGVYLDRMNSHYNDVHVELDANHDFAYYSELTASRGFGLLEGTNYTIDIIGYYY